MSRSWTLAGAFDAGHIRGGTPGWERELDFHQLEISGHAEQLEADYRLFREEFGLTMFRDGAWLGRTCPRPNEYDWSYLDRVAAVSQGQVFLSLCHYEWLPWLEVEDVWNGRAVEAMEAFAGEVASRYRGSFAGYLPVVEIGYWTAMMTDWARWWPARAKQPASSWWKMYGVTGRMMVRMARAVREADPQATIALSEPWAWHPHMPLADQGRPFDTLLGRPDPVAKRECGDDRWGGDSSLLQFVGLNFYNDWGTNQGWPLSRLLLEARKRYPHQRLGIGETGNCHFAHCNTVEAWLELIDREVGKANAEGARVELVTWAPILTLGDFDWGTPAPGAWVTWSPDDPARVRHWDPAVVQAVRRFTSRTVAGSSKLL
jgi:hypothetical protein